MSNVLERLSKLWPSLANLIPYCDHRIARRRCAITGRAETPGPEVGCRVSQSHSPVPHIARLMALAIKFKGMLETGVVNNQSELVRLAHVTPLVDDGIRIDRLAGILDVIRPNCAA